MKKLHKLLFLSAMTFGMADDAPAATGQAPASTAQNDLTDNAAPVATVEVAAEHADLIQRAVTLLESGATWIKDNIEAGITTLEKLLEGEPKNGTDA